jgi:hypothetical protein
MLVVAKPPTGKGNQITHPAFATISQNDPGPQQVFSSRFDPTTTADLL